MVIKIILSLVLFIHGLAHLGGVFAPITKDHSGFKNTHWLFSNKINLDSRIAQLWGVIWLVAAIGFVSSAYGFYFQTSWVTTVVFMSAIYSLVAMIPWFNAVPAGAKVGMVFDLIVIVFLVVSQRIQDTTDFFFSGKIRLNITAIINASR